MRTNLTGLHPLFTLHFVQFCKVFEEKTNK